MKKEFKTKISQIRKSDIVQLNRQIPPQAHTPMYNWHKFWSRKTWNVVAEFIKNYCPPGGVVFDPFAGSGVTALEALKNKRRAIVCDILPISTEIIRLTIKPVSLIKLHEAFKWVEKKVKNKINDLYRTKCRKCGHEFPATCFIWKQKRVSENQSIKRELVDVRYIICPRCGERKEKNNPPIGFDQQIIKNLETKKIKEWYPKNRLYHANGRPFMKKERYESLDELFTKRNLQALAWLMEAIEKEPNRDLRDFLKIGFSSIVHLCTVMCPDRPTRPFSSAWTEHSYWFANEFMEQNVWEKFESAIVGKQGLIHAKEETNKYFQNVRFGKSFEEVVKGHADILIHNGSCADLMKKMYQKYGDEGCVDYIFTDPPYDASVQYGELAYLWVAWLKMDKNYLERIALDEVIRNERQEKDFEVYHSLLKSSFDDMFNLLKPNKYLTVTFHNPTFKIRNATIHAGVFAGFEFQKVHHQELARPSAKSLLQPFGSAQGDFYLRFYKPYSGEKAIRPQTIDAVRFENIVVETAKRIIAERGEPTPYTILINAIDPELARRGFFSELNSGLDVKMVLLDHLQPNAEFALVSSKIGGAEGKLWWLRDPSVVSHLQKIPLTERVEQTVLRKLQQRGKVTFTEIWDAVSSAFPNSLTSDSMSIIDALKAYARPMPGGFWLIKPNFRPGEIEREHTTIIAILAEIGKLKGYKIWVGKVEQSHKITGLPKRSGVLKQYVNFNKIAQLKNINNADTVKDMDLLWIKDNKVISAFEVESTTSMTSGLQRGSNIESKTPKFLVMPEEREGQFLKKLKSPMFSERFKMDHWNAIYFGVLANEYFKSKKNVNLAAIVNKKIPKILGKQKNENQQSLF